MKFCIISDLHGYLDFTVEPCDALLIAGDIVDLGVQGKSLISQIWFEKQFFPWAIKQPCDKVFFIGGNHDGFLACCKPQLKKLLEDENINKDGKCVYLNNEIVDYNGISIYGNPYSKIFGSWWFMKEDDTIKDMIKETVGDKKIDIILAHDMPYTYSDVLLQKDCRWAKGEHIGTKAYKWAIDTYEPRYYFGGHLHSCNHEENKVNDGKTSVYCVSIKNEHYEPVYKPLYLDIEANKENN